MLHYAIRNFKNFDVAHCIRETAPFNADFTA